MNTWTWLWISANLLALLSVPSVLLERRGRPQAAVAWILALFSLPWLGLLLWWLIGRRHLKRAKRARWTASRIRSQELGLSRRDIPSTSDTLWQLSDVRFNAYEGDESVFPATDNNRVELLVDAKEAYPCLERMIVDAKCRLDLMFYIWQPDQVGRKFRDLLVERARAGVQVRVLYDGWGSMFTPGRFMAPLRAAGARVAVFMPARYFMPGPLMNFRNHRKIVVADGEVGFLGGLNIGREYTRDWRDLAIRLEGGVVPQLQDVFDDDWYYATGSSESAGGHVDFPRVTDHDGERKGDAVACGIVAGGPHTTFNTTHDAFFLAITSARERIWIITPYFVPDSAILMALRTAVRRGVDVQVLMPGKTGNHPMAWWAARSYFPELLRSGVRIFEYNSSMLHTKAALFDHDLSVVGSANMDIRSFRLNFEISCFIRGRAVNQRLRDLATEYLNGATEIRCADLDNQPYLTRVGESLAHLLSPLL